LALRLGAASIETRDSWVVAFTVVAILAITSGTPWILVVALKPVAADLCVARNVPALAGSLAVLGAGLGAIAMGPLAERCGVRVVVLIGSAMVCAGLATASSGGVWSLCIGYGLMVGLLGNAGINLPLLVHVSRWFDRHRGSALALVASGQYIGGTVWPALLARGLNFWGWRHTMLSFGVLQFALVSSLVVLLRTHLSARLRARGVLAGPRPGAPVLGMPPNRALTLLSVASFLCCIPMALPTTHLVALCTDLGLAPMRGVAILSALQLSAFASRQFWGWLSDRIGGLRSVLAGSICQVLAIAALLATQDEVGLFTAAMAFGLGFAGIIPAYAMTVRELFPAAEAGWRLPCVSLGGTLGMAGGAWLGGGIYDTFGSYAPAFALGVAFNLLNIVLLITLIAGRRHVPAEGSAAAGHTSRTAHHA
jgi:MFS family permease